jgi:hypothetical protein
MRHEFLKAGERQNMVILERTDLYEECMNSVILSLEYESSMCDSMSCCLSHLEKKSIKTKNDHIEYVTGVHPPGHHFVEVSVGLCRINSSFASSYVAVVSKPATEIEIRILSL